MIESIDLFVERFREMAVSFSSIVPYEQVFGDYRDAANEALAEDYVPLGLKGYIRD